MEYWKVSARGDSILITCRGHDKSRTVQRALADFRNFAAARPEFEVVADVREMTGYESENRVHWQTLFRAYRTRITRLVLVGARSPLIRMGAAAVGAFAGIQVRFVDNWKELLRP